MVEAEKIRLIDWFKQSRLSIHEQIKGGEKKKKFMLCCISFFIAVSLVCVPSDSFATPSDSQLCELFYRADKERKSNDKYWEGDVSECSVYDVVKISERWIKVTYSAKWKGFALLMKSGTFYKYTRSYAVGCKT